MPEQHVGRARRPVGFIVREVKLRFGRREARDVTRIVENRPVFLGKASSKAGVGRRYHRFGASEIPKDQAQMAGLKAEIPSARQKLGESLRILCLLSLGLASGSGEVCRDPRESSFGSRELKAAERKGPSASPKAADAAHQAQCEQRLETYQPSEESCGQSANWGGRRSGIE